MATFGENHATRSVPNPIRFQIVGSHDGGELFASREEAETEIARLKDDDRTPIQTWRVHVIGGTFGGEPRARRTSPTRCR